MLGSRKMVQNSLKHSIRFCGIFLSLKHNFIAYRSSKVSDCIFEIHQLWQSGFSRVYSNCCCCCSFEPEIIKIGLSSHNMYGNNILDFQQSTPIVNAHTKKVWKLIEGSSYHTRVTIIIIIIIKVSWQHRFPWFSLAVHLCRLPVLANSLDGIQCPVSFCC